MVAPPKKLYWVDFRKNGSKRAERGVYGRHWAAAKGGKFTDEAAAKQRINGLRAEWPDAEIKLLTTVDLTWAEVPTEKGYPG